VRTLTPARRATDNSFIRFYRATLAGVRFARALGHAPQLVDQLERLAQSHLGVLAVHPDFLKGTAATRRLSILSIQSNPEEKVTRQWRLFTMAGRPLSSRWAR